MHAASRHGTPSLTSLPKDVGVSCFGRSSISSTDSRISNNRSLLDSPSKNQNNVVEIRNN